MLPPLRQNHLAFTEQKNEMIRKDLLDEALRCAVTIGVAFLSKIDDFDLNEYIKAIHFDEMKVPTVPFQIPSSRTCFGLKEMMEAELDFMKATVLSKSMEPVTMYSDMPLEEMAKDPEFPKKWMFGLSRIGRCGWITSFLRKRMPRSKECEVEIVFLFNASPSITPFLVPA